MNTPKIEKYTLITCTIEEGIVQELRISTTNTSQSADVYDRSRSAEVTRFCLDTSSGIPLYTELSSEWRDQSPFYLGRKLVCGDVQNTKKETESATKVQPSDLSKHIAIPHLCSIRIRGTNNGVDISSDTGVAGHIENDT